MPRRVERGRHAAWGGVITRGADRGVSAVPVQTFVAQLGQPHWAPRRQFAPATLLDKRPGDDATGRLAENRLNESAGEPSGTVERTIAPRCVEAMLRGNAGWGPNQRAPRAR
jgi:hypothetical protein